MTEQSSILDIAPRASEEIDKKISTKNTVSSILNRIRDLENKAKSLNEELSFLRKNIEEVLDE